jgi:hypothetical protein
MNKPYSFSLSISALLMMSLAAVTMTTTTANAYKFDQATYTGSVNRGELMKALDLSGAELRTLDTSQLEFVWATTTTLTWQCQTQDGVVHERVREHRSIDAPVVNFEVNTNPQGQITSIDITGKSNKHYGVSEGDSPLHCSEPLVLVEGSDETVTSDPYLAVRDRTQPGAWVPI